MFLSKENCKNKEDLENAKIILPSNKRTLEHYELILTENCNFRCKYCFDDSFSNRTFCNYNYVMSLDMIPSIINFIEKTYNRRRRPNINFFRGEPTSPHQFKDILNSALNKGKTVTVITNFLFNAKIKEFLIEKIKERRPVSFLVNPTDLDVLNRIKIWKENYEDIYTALYNIDREESISRGITLCEKKDV